MAIELLGCGHPEWCWQGEYDDDKKCVWCHEIAGLQSTISALRVCRDGASVVVKGGRHVLRCNTLDILVIEGGTVEFAPPDMAITTMLPTKGTILV